MSKKYYEMEVQISGIVRIPIDEYDDKETAIECVEMSDDVASIAYNIQRNNDKEYYINVNRKDVKEIEY